MKILPKKNKFFPMLFKFLLFLGCTTHSIFSNPLLMEDEIYKYRTKRGWDELNNLKHFEKARDISEEALKKIKASSDPAMRELEADWENKKQSTLNRIKTYEDLRSNVFRMGPLLSNSYDTHHLFNPGFKTAVEQTMNEVKDVLRQISIREGQVSVLFVQKNKHNPEVEEVAYRKLEGIPFYNPIPMEDQIELFGEILTYDKIITNPDVLSGFFINEKWERIYIISIEKLNVHIDNKTNFLNDLIQKIYYLMIDEVEKEAYYNISIHKYLKNEKEKLVHLAFMDTTGVYTGEYFNTSFLESSSLSIFAFLGILAYIYHFYDQKNPKRKKSEVQKIESKEDKQAEPNNTLDTKKEPDFLDRFDLKQFGKTIFNCILFFLLGLLFAYGIGYGSELIIGSWIEHKGSLALKTKGLLWLFNLLIYPILLILLFKISDYVVVVKQKAILPILFVSFSLGIAIYMHFYIEFYNKIFYLEDQLFLVIPFFMITLINGYILGETYREGIDLNSKKRFFYIDENGKKINHPPFRLILRFGVFILLIFMNAIFGESIFYAFLEGDIITYYPYLFSFFIWGTLYGIKITKKDFQIPDINHLDTSASLSFVEPKSLEDLRLLLDNPESIPYHLETGISVSDFRESLKECMKEEGGIILISGGKWVGKKRLLKEVLQDEFFKHRTEFKIQCTTKVESKFLPFIEGMKNLPQIESILENIKIGKETKKAASILSSIFSIIPIAGGLISKFLESGIDLTSKEKEKEKYILDTLANTVQELTIELQALSGTEGMDRDQVLFLLENFQDVDDSTLHVIETIKKHLQDDTVSPEKNYVAFILFLNNDSRFINEELFKEIKLLEPKKHFSLNGLTLEDALQYFRKYLKFAANRNNDELFSKIFSLYSEEMEIEKMVKNELKKERIRFISPKYILETIRFELLRDENKLSHSEKNEFSKEEKERITLLSGSFVYNGKPLKISISDKVYKDYNYRIDKLNPQEIEILEVASVLGNRFNLSEVSYILNQNTISISKAIKAVEREGDILVRQDNSGEFSFKKGIYREVFKKRIFSSKQFLGDEVAYQLYTEYCNRGVDYFVDKKRRDTELSDEEKKRFAHISFYASKKFLNEFIMANLEYAEYAYTVPDLQIDGLTCLEKIVIHLGFNKEDLFKYLSEHKFLNKFISIFSFYINDFQELISGNFTQLNPIIEILYENHELFYKEFLPEQLNHLTATYLFTKKPDNISLRNQIDVVKINEKALKECKSEEGILIAKFWEAFLFRIKLKTKEGIIPIDESIHICNTILKDIEKIKNPYWKKSYHSRILNNLGQSYQIKYKETKDPEDRDNALDHLNKCIVVKEEIKDHTGIAMALGTRASLHTELESIKKDLELGIESNIKVKNYGGVAYLYGVLEKIMNDNNQLEEALRYGKLKEETDILNRIPSKK